MVASRDDDTGLGSPLGRVPAPSPGRGLAATGLLVTLLLGVAIAKPWDWGGAGPGSRGPYVARPTLPAPATPAPTADLTPAGLAAEVCLGTGAWRVASLETWQIAGRSGIRAQQVRVWRAVSPVTGASGPDDPGIPIVAVAAMRVDGLGWCAPTTGSGSPLGPVVVRAFHLDPTGATVAETTLRQVAPDAGVTPFGALYRATSGCGVGACADAGATPTASGWAAGRYVFRFDDTSAHRVLWFGAELVILPGPTIPPVSPAPRAH